MAGSVCGRQPVEGRLLFERHDGPEGAGRGDGTKIEVRVVLAKAQGHGAEGPHYEEGLARHLD